MSQLATMIRYAIIILHMMMSVCFTMYCSHRTCACAYYEEYRTHSHTSTQQRDDYVRVIGNRPLLSERQIYIIWLVAGVGGSEAVLHTLLQ